MIWVEKDVYLVVIYHDHETTALSGVPPAAESAIHGIGKSNSVESTTLLAERSIWWLSRGAATAARASNDSARSCV
jgi:hypothetical protein